VAGEGLALSAVGAACAPGNRWAYFGLASLLVQWVVLSTLGGMYLLRSPLSRRRPLHVAYVALLLLLLSTWVVALASRLLVGDDWGAGPVDWLDLFLRFSGIALAVGLETRSISADIGTVPVGFAVGGAVGGVRWEDAIGSGGLRLTIEGSRRALNDSLLAFAGSTDARTGRVWGGVRATGLRSQLSWEQDDVGLYGYGGAQALTGRGVASNNRLEAGGGGYWRARSTPDDRLELGLNLGYQHYRRNLSGYTLGHGGYFSPQHLLALTVPVNWTGRSGRLSWGVQGAAGLQTYREESAPYFPTEAGLQSWLESLVAAGQTPTARYAARSDSGMTLNLGGALEYQITRQLDVGARIGFEHAPQYSQGMGSVYLRFSLEPRGTATGGLRMPAGPALQ